MARRLKRTTIYLPEDLKKKAKEKISNLSAFVQDMIERDLAGEFKLLKIDKLRKELALAESENSVMQTQRQNQKERAKKSYEDAEAEALKRRRQNMQRKRVDL